MSQLYLFDIDGTLVDTGGAGMKALIETTRERFGDDGPMLDLAGSTDLGIVNHIHAHFKVDATPESIEHYFSIYHQRLDWNLRHGGFPGRVIDGATMLLDALSQRDDATIGLLTGNTEAGAHTKVTHFGLSEFFPFGAYGSDHHDRNQLGPIALQRATQHSGRTFAPTKNVWIIGDTPKDIACAHAIGAKCLAVATGQFTSQQLHDFGADRVVESLDEAVEWL
jgi:phosphoglycolate phosphatase-like HAD superfamily hydrolase